MKTLDLCSYKLHVAEALLAALPPPNEEISDSEDENEAIPRNRPAGPPSTARRYDQYGHFAKNLNEQSKTIDALSQPVPAVNQPFDVNVISQPEPAPYDVIEILGAEVKDKWKILKDFYRKRVNFKHTSSGSAAQSPRKKWKFEEQMNFIKDTVAPSPMVGNLQTQEDERNLK
ncbi:hypothetical protein M8J76_015890 [Diaphorina citri]|nr:hypothetical protein M8J76_002491 [Diaphorina citri]KAI5709340.1 hypothetical protein M8J76_015890 [Diaphorina citri]